MVWSHGRTSSLVALGCVSTPSQQLPSTGHPTTTRQAHREPSHVHLASAKGATAKSSKTQHLLGVLLRVCRSQSKVSFPCLQSFTELAPAFLSPLPYASPGAQRRSLLPLVHSRKYRSYQLFRFNKHEELVCCSDGEQVSSQKIILYCGYLPH